MPVFSYKTIRQPVEGIYREKASKFHAFAFPVSTVEAVKGNLALLKKKYFDAQHHCYAYVLGAGKDKFRSFDDGEPRHSAGDPILGQLRARELTNVLVVVVRYFGGTKLGVGGLTTAYKMAAAEALDKIVLIVEEVMQEIIIFYEYEATTEVMRLVKAFDLQIVGQSFDVQCTIQLKVKLLEWDALLKKLNLLVALNAKISWKVIEGDVLPPDLSIP